KEKEKREKTEGELLELRAEFEKMRAGEKTPDQLLKELDSANSKLREFELKAAAQLEQRRESLEARGSTLKDEFKDLFSEILELGNLDLAEKQLLRYEALSKKGTPLPPRS